MYVNIIVSNLLHFLMWLAIARRCICQSSREYRSGVFFDSQSRQIPIVHIASQVAQVGQQIEPHETIKSTLHMVTFGAMWAMSFIHFYPVSQHIPANHGEFASGIGFLAPLGGSVATAQLSPGGVRKMVRVYP